MMVYTNDGIVRKKKKKKTPMEFSKKIFFVITGIFVSIIIYSMVLMWATKDTSPLAYLIPSAGGMMMVGVGFYYWKSKMENCLRITQSDREAALEKLQELNAFADNFNVDTNNVNY